VTAAPHSTILSPCKTLLIAALAVVALLVTMSSARAGVTGTEFQATYELIVGWAKGYLGKIFAVAAFLIGCGFSAARQNPMPAIFGLVLALIIGFGPGLIESILTATV
jgi:conjugal transfer pilus assembly protein TraA